MSIAHKRVLVLEDDRDVRELLGSMLRHRGLTVDEASGGREALDLLGENGYSVILLDLLMPQPDGFAVLRAIEERPPSQTPVVLVLTAADRSLLDQLDSDRIHGIVRKPFDPEEVASLVVACSEIRSRGSFGMMAVAVMSGARFIDLLSRL
ncbi:MAG TPA: response regulator [Thermoanaerobaculia bacterium]|nr:response regulator [Thermoanaerobaculia bacterium]